MLYLRERLFNRFDRGKSGVIVEKEADEDNERDDVVYYSEY